MKIRLKVRAMEFRLLTGAVLRRHEGFEDRRVGPTARRCERRAKSLGSTLHGKQSRSAWSSSLNPRIRRIHPFVLQPDPKRRTESACRRAGIAGASMIPRLEENP